MKICCNQGCNDIGIAIATKPCLFCTETVALHLTTKTINLAKQLNTLQRRKSPLSVHRELIFLLAMSVCTATVRDVGCLKFTKKCSVNPVGNCKWNTIFCVVSSGKFAIGMLQTELNSCSISSKPSLIPVSGLRGRFSIIGTDL